MEKMSKGMTESRMREGMTTPGSTPRGYPKLGRFNPGAEQRMGEAAKAENDGRQMPAQGSGER